MWLSSHTKNFLKLFGTESTYNASPVQSLKIEVKFMIKRKLVQLKKVRINCEYLIGNYRHSV